MPSATKRRKTIKSDTVNMGWIGDHGSIHYMESYKDVWEAIGRKYTNVVLTIISDTFIDTKDITLRRIPWSYEREIDDLMSLDIGLMPLFDDLWSKGKCGFKIIQYLGVGVPAVCTPVGINRDVVHDGVHGLWANTKDEWIEKLSTLIENASLREKMGGEGRRKDYGRLHSPGLCPKAYRVDQGKWRETNRFLNTSEPAGYRIQQYFLFRGSWFSCGAAHNENEFS